MFKRLFRVYAHIYHSHFIQIQKLGEEAHLNTVCLFCSVLTVSGIQALLPICYRI
jgi:hypothetical protein